MLILDVKTRWSSESTHQMLRQCYIWIDSFSEINISLGCALDNRDSIETFVLRYKNLQPFKLSGGEWDAAAMISMDLSSSSCINIH